MKDNEQPQQGDQAITCAIEQLQYGGKCYLYCPVGENGEPLYESLDTTSASEALRMTDETFYYCQACGSEWYTWEEAKQHPKDAA